MSVLKTNNYIGKDGLHGVYKGVVDNAVVVAKKMHGGSVREREIFENEVIIQSQVVHKNILRLIGCCLEMDKPVLVHEFVSRGSLQDILHDGSKAPLNLYVRLTMVAESAQGLAYLHSQAHSKILHGHVTPASILLDDNFIPKITRFVLSKLIPIDKQYSERIFGDKSYMDPVYMETCLLTEKSDVYSFGVVILEVISRVESTYSDGNDLVKSFLEVHQSGKKATEQFDKEIAVPGNLEILDCLAEIAVQCLNLDLDQRPTMTYVAERLLRLQRYHRTQVFGR